MTRTEDEGQQVAKSHHKKQAGPQAEKKKAKDKHVQEYTAKQRNPKAFTFNSINKTAKAVRRTLDVKERKHHIPVVDRTPVEPPPVLIAVFGPPKVGKTTLIQCLIKNFTRQKLTNISGPVTLVSGKKRRITLVECNNDINCMIDLAKVADLVLLLVDASFGFEMEIFEFLNICQVHGFPKIMGVLTHLDHFKQNKALRKTKKKLKHRFWTEVYQGAKLFYLSGMVNGEYQKTEIHNLGRFISVMKFRPLQWRTTHPHLLADRMEDVTDPELIRTNPKADRSICLYGFVRGTHLKNNSSIHIAGSGDFTVHDMSYLPDPCPLPHQEKKRSLNEKEKLIYAPMSGVGGIVYDKDAVYIDLGGSHSHKTQEEEKPENELVSTLIDTQETLDQKMMSSHVSLFTGMAPITHQDIKDIEMDNAKGRKPKEERVFDNKTGRFRRKVMFADQGESEDDDGDSDDHNSDDGYGDDEEESEVEQSDVEEDSDESGEEEDSEKEDENTRFNKKAKMDEEAYVFDEDDSDLEVTHTELPRRKMLKLKSNDGKQDVNESNDETDSQMSGSEDELDSESNDSSKHENPEMIGKKAREEMKMQESETSLNKLKEVDVATKVKTILESLSHKAQLERMKQDLSKEKSKSDEDADAEEEEMDVDHKAKEINFVSEQENAETGHLKWKENLLLKASESFHRRQQETPNLRKLIYGTVTNEGSEEEDSADEVGGLFKVARRQAREKKAVKALANAIDCSRFVPTHVQDWDLQDVMDSIKDCFVTGKWEANQDAEMLLKQDDELFGDFEDLETGQVYKGKGGEEEVKTDEEDEVEEEETEGNTGWKSREQYKEDREKKIAARRAEKKARVKAMFDSEYDEEKDGGTYFDSLKAEMEHQAQLNRKEFEDMDEETRAQYEGFRPGVYVRVQVDNVPYEFTSHFDPTYPIIVGALLHSEQNIGYVQVRIKKHRWFKKILKTRDPLIVSLGWRRFQSVVLYSIQDHNGRHRLLKYTPEHLHCNATMWGPITPQGTGMLAVQTLSGSTAAFRIAATGVVLELDKSITIVKKLKLTGTPMKIYKKTAMIQNMFNSALEVAKFEGSSIRTVSGVRGQIKKAVKTPQGAFRATFEDKILLSDIVFVRTWYPVQVPQFYNPVTTLLLPPDERNQWQGMKTLGQLKREKNIKNQVNEDHLYKPIMRKERRHTPLTIPRYLQRQLPFKDKPKLLHKAKDPVQSQRIAVVKEPKERKIAELMRVLKVLHEDKMRTRRQQMRQRVAQYQKEQERINEKRMVKQKEVKKQIYRALGKAEKRKNKYDKD